MQEIHFLKGNLEVLDIPFVLIHCEKWKKCLLHVLCSASEKATETITDVNWELFGWVELQVSSFCHLHLLITLFHPAPISLERISFLI